jgi:hypothetical protein
MKSQAVTGQAPIKVIEITFANGVPKVADKHKVLQLSRLRNEEVRWECDLSFRIDFKNGSPFYEDQFDQDHPQSGLARRSLLPSEQRIYEYTIEVKGKTLDPGIKIYP